MDRREIVLASLRPANGGFHTPVQIQKLLFVIDRELARQVNGPHFNFQPYDYGPFDKAVYDVVEELESEGLVVSATTPRGWKKFALTHAGQEIANLIMSKMDERACDYIIRLSSFVRSLTFPQLVSAIYKTYPEMKVNSVFKN